ncbi:hypothetical protein [Candidatus Protochlamydia phocaeensis]|uniref:hypothetical protein n=1 Tax=Candidatus Protochlamydia phocaeensis TaxID=1414722 RepID=UPI000838508F|nr:hypothetical protein [Candidatus Protochlamydia phocaeensis]
MRLFPFLLLASIPFLGFCEEEIPPSQSSLPGQLLYQGKPIPDAILEDFFGFAVAGFGEPSLELDIPASLAEYEEKLSAPADSEEEIDSTDAYRPPKTVFEWEYIGSIHNDFHVVRAYTWETGCLGKFTGLLILKREGDTLKIADTIYGGDRHSSMIFEGDAIIRENMILYHQAATSGNVVDKAMELYPEIEEVYLTSSSKKMCYGEAGYYGSFEKAAEISPDGKVVSIDILQFSPCEGSEHEEKLYEEGGLKALALDLLVDEDEKAIIE